MAVHGRSLVDQRLTALLTFCNLGWVVSPQFSSSHCSRREPLGYEAQVFADRTPFRSPKHESKQRRKLFNTAGLYILCWQNDTTNKECKNFHQTHLDNVIVYRLPWSSLARWLPGWSTNRWV